MATSAEPDVSAPAGYISEGAKRRFTITAGVLGAVFFVLQIALPFVLMLALMPVMMLTMEFEESDPDHAALWQGKVWYPQRRGTPARGPGGETMLVCAAPGAEGPPQATASLPSDKCWLLAGEECLWIVSDPSGEVATYREGKVTPVSSAKVFGDLSRPFLYEGQPAVVEIRPDRQVLWRFVDASWDQEASFRLRGPELAHLDARDLQVVATGRSLHLFMKFGGTLYYREGLPDEREEGRQQWQQVDNLWGSWATAVVDGRPVVFLSHRESGQSRLLGLEREEGQWRRFFEHPAGLWSAVAVLPAGDDAFVLILESAFSTVRILEVRAGEVVNETRHGSAFPFSGSFLGMMFIPHIGMFLMPLILAFILSSLMRRYRVVRHAAEGHEAFYAPLWRRALAQMVDGAILGAPFVAAFVFMLRMFGDFPLDSVAKGNFPLPFFLPHIFMCAGIPWALAVVLLYSFLEGRWGVTPGKRLLHIRVVGVDLQPCGFGRALVRNLLKFVDGFFNFMVGILVVALTENWQRVGDLAARTVVVNREAVRGTQQSVPQDLPL